MIQILKKDKTVVPYDSLKIVTAIKKSAERIMFEFSDNMIEDVIAHVESSIKNINEMPGGDDLVSIGMMHVFVEKALEKVCPEVATSYREYRNYKTDFVKMLDEVYAKSQSVMYIGDKSNSNTDSALVTTKRSIVYGELNKELYNKFFLRKDERQACKDGYIYIHDKSSRRDTLNCCLFDANNVMLNGFEMGNMWYNEPKGIDTACDVLGDIIMNSASMQYGGWSARVDEMLAYYCQKSFLTYFHEHLDILESAFKERKFRSLPDFTGCFDYAKNKTIRDLEQGIQGLEYKLNSVASSRGDYPFTTFAFGTDMSFWGKIVCSTLLRVRKEGQGKKGFKRPVLFPKLVFLFDKNLHGPGSDHEDLFDEAVNCSSKCMYPDFLSLTGEGYVPSMYKEYGEIVFPMGCRAFLSPWYRNGGMDKKDDQDTPVFTGRFNIGAVTLNLIMIYEKAHQENKDFFEVLDYYLQMIRNVHLRTYEYLGKMKASTNPLAFCEGGFYGGNLNPNDCIEPLLWSATASFGITGLNELEVIATGDSIASGGNFSIKTMEYINSKINEFKYEDGRLYAIYGTPAESLCGLQIEQFRAKYGIIEGVSDKTYTSNSFHCHVSEDITPVQKQDLESRFWNLFNGGKIQYVRYPINYNLLAIKSLVLRAMDLGYYEGINLALSYCNECGHQEVNMESCPKCGTGNLTKIDRMNGYLSYSRVKGDTMLNKAKMDEINDRKSM